MTEEYMTSAEIRQKIAELKIRLAFQLEFEKELAETLAECEGAETEQPLTDRDAEILRKIEAETKKRNSRNVGRRRTRRVGRIIAIATILMMISVGSAFAAICGLVEAGILKFDVKVQEKGTIFKLLRLENRAEMPEGWQGEYYPTYIPEGYSIKYTDQFGVCYIDKTGKEIKFSEKIHGRRNGIDTEDAMISNVMLNGTEAMVVEKNEWISVVWSRNGKYFIVEVQEDREMALRIAVSVSLIE